MHKRAFLNVLTSVREGNIDQVRKLINNDKNQKQAYTHQKKQNLLTLAVLSKHLLLVKYLSEIGVDKEEKDYNGKTAVDYAKDALASAKGKEKTI